MNPIRSALVCIGCVSTLSAQQQATTLHALAARAHVVVVATATAATDPSPDWHRIEFRAGEVLAGTVEATFALLEPAGRCCGRALFALRPGDRCLLFLERRSASLHPLGGDRGVVPFDAAVVAHVRALRAAGAAAARVLAAALFDEVPRVRDDAALALASLPDLAADAFVRDRVAAALQRETALASARLPALADAAVRTDRAAAATLLPLFLVADDDAARVLASALQRLPPGEVGAAVAATPLRDDRSRVRAAELLLALPEPGNVATLDRMLTGAVPPRVALAAAEALLAHGTAPEALAGRVPAAVLDLARRRRAAAADFRVVRPGFLP